MQAPPQFTITTSQPGTMNIAPNAAQFNYFQTAATAQPPQNNSASEYWKEV